MASDAAEERRSRSSSLTLSALADLAEAVESSSSSSSSSSPRRARSASLDNGGGGARQRSRRGTLLSSGGAGGAAAGIRDSGSSALSVKKKRRKTAAGAAAAGCDGFLASASLVSAAIGGGEHAGKGKAKQRLERNRDAAQAYRRRKKEQLLMLSARIAELEAENAALRMSMDAGVGDHGREATNSDESATGSAVNAAAAPPPGAAAALATGSASTRVVFALQPSTSTSSRNGGLTPPMTDGNGDNASSSSSSSPSSSSSSKQSNAAATGGAKQPPAKPSVYRGHLAQFNIYFNADMKIVSAPPEYFELFGSPPNSESGMSIAHGLSSSDSEKLFEACKLAQSTPFGCTRVCGPNRIQVILKIFPPVVVPGQEHTLLCASELALGFVVVNH